MKKNLITLTCAFALVIAVAAVPVCANITGSALTPTTKYTPGETNTLVYRCDAVTPDYEYMYTVVVNYLAGMNVITGYLATGEVNGGTFSYNGAAGDAAVARWDSDENLGAGYGSLVNGESAYFTNKVDVAPSTTGDVVLTYYLFGDGYAAGPHGLTNTLILEQWFPSVIFSPASYSKEVAPEKAGNYSLKLINDTFADDSFTISYTNSLWAASGPANSGTITLGDSTNFTVDVSVPADTLAGQVSTTIVTAVGVTDNSYTGTATIITYCTWTDTVMEEGFDDNPFDDGWKQYNLGAPTGWVWYTTYGNPKPCMKHWTIAQPCTNWLVTPVINLVGDFISAKLTFDEYYYNSDTNAHPYSYAGLWISTNQQNPTAGTYFELQEFGTHYGSWTGSGWDIDLLDYKGLTNVYLAFVYIGNDAANHYLDNVKLQTIKTGIDNVVLESPATIAMESYSNTPNITASLLIAGETGAAGPASNITAQIGYGIEGTTPDETWTWIPAVYSSSDATKDYFVTNGFVTVAGDFDYACRFKKGEASWVYGDLNGSTNGYSSDDAGKLTIAMLPVNGELIYEQTLSTDPGGDIVSFAASNATPLSIIVADDITPRSGSTIKSVRWHGLYDNWNPYPRDGMEKGFNLFIFTNAPADGTIAYAHPGGVVFSEYFPGYSCEQVVTGGLRKYTLNLTTPFHMEAKKKYWFALQQTTTGTSRWAMGPTADKIRGLEPEIKGISFGITNWTSETDAGLTPADLGIEIYGEEDPNVYLSPLEQTKTDNPSKTVSFNLNIKNQTDVTNTYEFSYQGTWLVTGPADSGVMLPNGTNSFSVDVTIPVNALDGEVVTSIVTATGITDPAYTNNAIIITECTWEHKLSCENFDGAWPPVGWTNFIISAAAGWTNSSPGADGSGNCAFHNDDSVDCDDWLITPLDLTSNSFDSFKVSFQNKIKYPTYYDASEVMISTGSINPADGDYVLLLNVGNTDTEWTKREVDLSAYVGSNIYLAFRYTGNFMHEWFVDDVCLIGIITPPSGILSGNVSDFNSGKPISGATITVNNGAYVLTTDTNGYYSQSLPTNSYIVSAAAANYVTQTVTNVEISDSATTVRNFELVGSVLEYSPSNIFETMYLGNIVTNTVTLTNSGPFVVDFTMRIRDFIEPVSAAMSKKINLPRCTEVFSCDNSKLSFGKATERLQNISALTTTELPELMAVNSLSYGNNAADLVSFFHGTPETLNTIGNTGTADIWGADFINNDFSTLYGVNSDNNLVKINTADAVVTLVGALPTGTMVWTGVAGHPNGTLYASRTDGSSSELFTINPASGSGSLVGTINNAPGIIGIAINTAGELFGLDIISNNLIRINTTTGAGTIVGSVGFNANYSQGMDFDDSDGTLYLAAYNETTAKPELRIADTTTGNSTLVGEFGDGTGELNYMAVATTKETMWATVSTNAGSLAAGAAATFDVLFDANIVSNPGTYSAKIDFSGNFVNDLNAMPLDMYIISPRISVTPSAIDFGQIVIDAITQTNINVKNTGTDSLTVDAKITNCVPASGWINLNWDSANIATGDIDYLEITVNTTGFSEGAYTCNVLFASNDPNSPKVYLPVSLEVIPEPALLLALLAGMLLVIRKI